MSGRDTGNGHWKTLTFLVGLRHDGIVAPFVLGAPINGEMFTALVGQSLPRHTRPRHPSGDIIADNPGSHQA